MGDDVVQLPRDAGPLVEQQGPLAGGLLAGLRGQGVGQQQPLPLDPADQPAGGVGGAEQHRPERVVAGVERRDAQRIDGKQRDRAGEHDASGYRSICRAPE